jgi:hypothetical protein
VKRRLFPTSPDNVRGIWLGLGLGILAAAAIVYALPPSWAGYRSGALALGLALSGVVIAVFSPLTAVLADEPEPRGGMICR